MTLGERVRTFVMQRAPRPICDECVADHLALRRKQVSAAGVRILPAGFSRYSGRCSGCCTSRVVTVCPQR
jgi:hypothetical protein